MLISKDGERMTAADICRAKGWQPGDVLRTPWRSVFRIESIGDKGVLVRFNSAVIGKAKWRKQSRYAAARYFDRTVRIGAAPLNDTPPRMEWCV